LAETHTDTLPGPPLTGSRLWVRAAVLAAPLVVMYYETMGALLGDWWNDPNNSHGLLIPPMALYIAWRKKSRLQAAAVDPYVVLGALGLLSSLAVYFVGRLGAEFFLTRVSLVGLLGSLILFFWGRSHFRLLFFPLVLLVLSIPIPALIINTISLPLQALASQLGAGFLSLCGVPVLREGNVIHLATTALGVAEACSGLRSLVSLFTLAVILAYLRWQGLGQRIALVLLAVPVALLLNVLRIGITGLIADYWDVKYAMGFFHEFSGWLVFLLAFGILFGASAVIQKLWPSPPPEELA